jgi:hypothetical protein
MDIIQACLPVCKRISKLEQWLIVNSEHRAAPEARKNLMNSYSLLCNLCSGVYPENINKLLNTVPGSEIVKRGAELPEKLNYDELKIKFDKATEIIENLNIEEVNNLLPKYLRLLYRTAKAYGSRRTD